MKHQNIDAIAGRILTGQSSAIIGKSNSSKTALLDYFVDGANKKNLYDGYETNLIFSVHNMHGFDVDSALPAEKIKLEKTLIWCDSKKKLS